MGLIAGWIGVVVISLNRTIGVECARLEQNSLVPVADDDMQPGTAGWIGSR